MNPVPTVVIVGAGFGGLNAARALRRAPAQVVLVDRNNYHLFQPLLYQVATAGLEPEEIAKPVRSILRGQKNFDFRLLDVTRVDFAAKRLETSAGPIAYDYLVLAPGGETNFFGLDSLQRYGLGLKDIPDAVAIPAIERSSAIRSSDLRENVSREHGDAGSKPEQIADFRKNLSAYRDCRQVGGAEAEAGLSEWIIDDLLVSVDEPQIQRGARVDEKRGSDAGDELARSRLRKERSIRRELVVVENPAECERLRHLKVCFPL